jgi:hypothetical protein
LKGKLIFFFSFISYFTLSAQVDAFKMRHEQISSQFKSQPLGEIAQRATIMGELENPNPYYEKTTDVLEQNSELHTTRIGYNQQDFYYRGQLINSSNVSINLVPIQSNIFNSSHNLWSLIDLPVFEKLEILYGQNLVQNNISGSANINFITRNSWKEDSHLIKIRPIIQYGNIERYIHLGIDLKIKKWANQFNISGRYNDQYSTSNTDYIYPNLKQLTIQNLVENRFSATSKWSHYVLTSFSNPIYPLINLYPNLTILKQNQIQSPTNFSYLQWIKTSEESKWYTQLTSSISYFNTTKSDSFEASHSIRAYSNNYSYTSNQFSIQSNGYKNLGSRAVYYYGGQLNFETINSDVFPNQSLRYILPTPVVHSHFYFKKEYRPSSDVSWIYGANLGLDQINAQIERTTQNTNEFINRSYPNLNLQATWTRHLCENSNYSIQAIGSYNSPKLNQILPFFSSSYFIANKDLIAEKKLNLEGNFYRKFDDKLEVNISGYYSMTKDAILIRDYYGENDRQLLVYGKMEDILQNQNANLASNYGINTELKYHISNQLMAYSTAHMNYQFVHTTQNKYSLNQLPIYGNLGLKFKQKKLLIQAWSQFNLGKNLDENYTRLASELKARNQLLSFYTLHLTASSIVLNKIKLEAKIDNVLNTESYSYLSQIANTGRRFSIQLCSEF